MCLTFLASHETICGVSFTMDLDLKDYERVGNLER